MKAGIVILLLPVVILLTGMNEDQKNRWSFRIYPLQDTLVQGVRNKLELLQDGIVTDTLRVTMYGPHDDDDRETPGYYIVIPSRGTVGYNFAFEVESQQDSLLYKTSFPVVANKGNIKKRVDLLLQQKIY